MKIQPIGDKVLIERILEPIQTESGLYIPDDFRDPSQEAKILAVGPECTDTIKVGDIVITAKYVGMQINKGKNTSFLVKEEDILGIIL